MLPTPRSSPVNRGSCFPARPVRAALFVVAVCLASRAALAQLPVTRLNAIFPPGGHVDSQLDVTITSGTDLEGVDRLIFSHPGITAAQKTQQVEGQDQPQPVANQFVITIAADVPPGRYDVRAVGTYGVSNPRSFLVDSQAQSVEAEPNNTTSQATKVARPGVIAARLEAARDVDWFQFEAAAGTRHTITCAAQSIDSRLEAVVEIYDSAATQLARQQALADRDVLLDFVAPADGIYHLKVTDIQFRGGQEYFYRLAVRKAPFVEFVFPPVAAPGAPQQITLYARNLTGGIPAGEVRVDGALLDQQQIEVTLPAELAARPTHPSVDWVPPHAAVINAHHLGIDQSSQPEHPLSLAVAAAPVVTETEPNDDPSAANVVELPCTFAGQFQNPADLDRLRFTATKGDILIMELASHRLGLPTDPLLVVDQITLDDDGNEKSKELAAADDDTRNIGARTFATSTHDPYYKFTAPEDGTYQVTVRDLHYQSRGDPRFVYVLSLRRPRPDYTVFALAEFPNDPDNAPQQWSTFVRKGGTDRVRLLAFRHDDFNGPITVEAADLPDGVTCLPVTIGPGQTRADLVFAAAADAPDAVAAVQLVATAPHGDAELVRDVLPASVVWPGNQNLSARTRLTDSFTLAVGGAAAFRVDSPQTEVTIPQSTQLEHPTQITRQDGYTEAVAATGIHLPPKVASSAVNFAGETTEALAHLYFPQDTPVGTYSFHLQTTAKVPFTKNADGSDKKPVDTIGASTPLTVTVVPGPLVIAAKVPNNGAVKRGESIEIEVQLTRRNEFAGPIRVDLRLPPDISGVAVEPVDVAADAKSAKLTVQTAADATVGNHANVVIRATLPGTGDPSKDKPDMELHQPIPLNITE